jgi:hypothetical protein
VTVPGQLPDDYDCTGDAAAYVLGALNAHEVGPFLRHLDGCAICRDEVASLQVVADMLPAAVTPVSAPRGIRRRVLATVYEEADLFAAAAPSAPAGGRRRRRRPEWRPAGRPVARPFQALAGAALVAAGIAVGTVALGGGTTPPRSRIVLASTTTPPTSALLRISGGRTELDVSSLAPPPSGRVYEVWLQRSGPPQPTDALFTPTSDGHATVAVPGDLAGVKKVLVTDEPSGGSPAPTGALLLSASLQ